ncbi:MAG TPA: glycerophosphodiester phosphodiesterase [Kofleriaceae bacterium]|nr:glycerophosphodiester phosphodiesterase [Kofleriaceae bacterium]
MHPLLLYAHRGATAELPENTMPAFRRALEIGVDALEMDVHMTRDGVPVVSHDPTAERMGGVRAAWRDLDLAAAQRIDLGARWGDGRHAGRGIRVPTFEEVLAELPVRINVDIKQHTPPMVKQMLTLIRKYKAEERVTIASFHVSTLLAVRRRGYGGETALSRPEVMLFVATPARLWRTLPFVGSAAQVPERAGPIVMASRWFIDKAHAAGLRVDFWTVDDPVRAEQLLELGADGIMTDDPAAIAPVFAKRRAAVS